MTLHIEKLIKMLLDSAFMYPVHALCFILSQVDSLSKLTSSFKDVLKELSFMNKYKMLFILDWSLTFFSFCCSYEEINATFDTVLQIVHTAVKKLSSPIPSKVTALHNLLSVLLYSSAKLKECCLSEHSRTTTINENLASMWKDLKKLLLDEWIVKYYSPTFGNPTVTNFRSAKTDIEVKWVWGYDGYAWNIGITMLLLFLNYCMDENNSISLLICFILQQVPARRHARIDMI